MESLQRLPESNVIYDYLKQDCLTVDIESGILRRISEAVANRLFNRTEIESSIKDLNLSCGLLQISHVGYALQCCVEGRARMARIKKYISEKKDETLDIPKDRDKDIEKNLLIFPYYSEIFNGSIQPTEPDYRKEVPMIRNRIVQLEKEGWEKYDRKVEKYGKDCALASYDGPLPESPARPLPNFLGIISPKRLLIQLEKNSFPNMKMVIKTGDLIHDALKKNNLEAYYFNKFEKIIVLSSSNISSKELKLIFEKCYFNIGLYPIVEDERTEFGDLMIHISDKPPSLIEPLILPSKTDIFAYLRKDNVVNWYVSVNELQIIAEKLDNEGYVPQETLKNLNLSSEISLNPLKISILDDALTRCAKGFPPRK